MKRPPSDNLSDHPSLAEAQAEIAAVFEKYDLGGAVIMQTPHMAHYFILVDPSWTCIRYTEIPNIVHVKCLLKDFPNLEEQKKVVDNTIGFLISTIDVARIVSEQLTALVKTCTAKMTVHHRTIQRNDSPPYHLE